MAVWLAVGIPVLALILLVAWVVRYARKARAAEARIDWSRIRRWDDDEED